MTLVDGNLTKGRAMELLSLSTAQPVLELRKFQKLYLETSPKFTYRRLRQGYCAQVAFRHRNNPEWIEAKLQEYDTLRQAFASNPEVSIGVLTRFCLKNPGPNGAKAEIQDWLKSIQTLPAMYFQKLDKAIIKEMAYTKRGKELVKELDNSLRQIDNIMEVYKIHPHPAIDRNIIEFAVIKRSSSQEWLMNDYLVRWEYVQKHIDTSDIPHKVLRRLVLFSPNAPLSAVESYRRICKQYEGDTYIGQWMIDEAIVWSLKQAKASLRRAREMLRNATSSLDRTASRTSISSRSSHETVGDNLQSPEDAVVERIFNQQTITALVGTMSPMEKAVIAAVYDIPWLVPADLRDEDDVDIVRVMAYYHIKTPEELQPIAAGILSRLRPDR